jgi:MYXO-CTERM domain-containing protein
VREDDGSEGGGGRVVIDVIVLGADKSRSTKAVYFDGELDETFLTIRNGNRALMYNEDAEPAYTVLEAADEYPEQFFEELSLGPESPQFQQACPGAKPSGERTILGRDAVGYACEPRDPCSSTKSEEIWLDKATGLLLEFGVKKAKEVTVDPVIDETTFATTPPAGADVHVVKATGKGAPAPSGSENEQALNAADALRKVAATSPTPIYYLGPDFEGVALCEVAIFANSSEVIGDLSLDAGETVSIWYGEDFEMSTEPFQPGNYGNATVGCERLDPVRGVPTVAQADAVWLFTADLVIRLGGLAYTPEKIAPAGAALRVAGQEPTSEDLPAPLADNVSRVDSACGASPVGKGNTVPGIVVAIVLLAAVGAAVAVRRRRVRAARPS